MSTGSLSDDLTSPSPSPPPRPVPPTRRPGRPKKPPKKPPPPKKEKGEPMPKAPGVEIAMDSGSELSELTEDDDGAHANQRRLSQEGSVDDDDEQGEQDDHDDDANNLDDDDSLPRDAKRKVKPRARNKKPPSKARPAASSTSSGSNGTIKRKRSSIIPPTMWGWVAPGTGTTSAVEEEEEEDAQPRAMEEESASDQDIKERDDTEEADEPANGMDVDEPMLAAPIESAAAATLLDLLAVASPELINGAADQNTESEDDDGEDEIDVQDAPVVTVETLASVKRIARRASAARPPPVDDRPVSPISQDGDEPDGPSRQVSPVSERSADDEQDKSDIEVDAPDKSDPEEEPENEAKSDNDEQVEMELQPAHRAEALDVLAGIELKYALLRQAIYLDRMEGLGWEEALVQAGTHPEMLHLQRELMARRDRRIELATRKRSFECVDAGRKRSAAEHGVWTWWKLARDDLQTDMITETNTKRRKMERDRRGTERPLPSRRIPSAPPPHAPPPPPDLRRILKGEAPLAPTEQQTSRIRTRSQRSAEPRPNENAPPALVFPDIACLSAADIANDLSHILRQSQPPPPPPVYHDLPPPPSHMSNRARMGLPPAQAPPQAQAAPAGQPLYEQGYPRSHHPMAPQHQQAPPQFQQQQPVGPGSGPGFGRTHHHPQAPPPHHIQHHVHPPQGAFELGYGGPYPPGRRPDSPAGRWAKPNDWAGGETRVIGDGRIEPPQGRVIGMGMPIGRHAEDDERERMMKRERDRDRERDRELLEIDRRLPEYVHLHRPVVGPHHHHHHHHHVVHHHHPTNPGPSRPSLSPRASREFDNRIHDGSRAELINIGSSKSSSNDPAARYERDRDRDRPSATPFVMGGSYGNSGPGSGRSMRTPPPVSGPTQPRASSRALEDAFRMPPSSSTSVGYLGDAVHHPSSPRRYSQSLQGPPLPGSSSSSSSSRPPPPPRPSGLSGLSPPLHRTLPPPNNNSSSAFGGGSNGASRYGPNPPALNGQSPMMAGGSGLGARAPTPSRSPVLVRAERDRIPSPPPNKMMVGAMMNGPPPPSSYSNSSRTTTPTVASDEKSGLRNDSPFFASISNPAPPYANKPSLSVHHPSKGDSERDSKVDKLPARISPPPVLAPPPSVLPPIPTQPKSERVQGL